MWDRANAGVFDAAGEVGVGDVRERDGDARGGDRVEVLKVESIDCVVLSAMEGRLRVLRDDCVANVVMKEEGVEPRGTEPTGAAREVLEFEEREGLELVGMLIGAVAVDCFACWRGLINGASSHLF